VFRPNLYDAAIAGPGEPAGGIGAFACPAFGATDIEAHLSARAIKRRPAG
jgi:hypothetical protein